MYLCLRLERSLCPTVRGSGCINKPSVPRPKLQSSRPPRYSASREQSPPRGKCKYSNTSIMLAIILRVECFHSYSLLRAWTPTSPCHPCHGKPTPSSDAGTGQFPPNFTQADPTESHTERIVHKAGCCKTRSAYAGVEAQHTSIRLRCKWHKTI